MGMKVTPHCGQVWAGRGGRGNFSRAGRGGLGGRGNFDGAFSRSASRVAFLAAMLAGADGSDSRSCVASMAMS